MENKKIEIKFEFKRNDNNKVIEMDSVEKASTSSEASQEVATFEDTYGYKIGGSNNYMFTTYHHDISFRDILFDGAVPVHEMVEYLYDFFYKYINNYHSNISYYISVIFHNGIKIDTTNIVIMNSFENKVNRIEECKKAITKITTILDIIFSSFISEDLRKIKNYRLDTPFKKLIDSYIMYQELKVKLGNLVD